MTALSTELRLKALTRLAGSSSQDAYVALSTAFQSAVDSLPSESHFEKLVVHLETISTIGFRFPPQAVEALAGFLSSVETRSFDHAEGYQDFASDEFFGELYGPAALMVKAMDALATIRYLETKAVLKILLPLSAHHWEKCRKKALELLAQVASYEISVFFGSKTRPGIGAYPQQEALSFLERLTVQAVKASFPGVLVLLRKFLSEQIRGTDWSYNKVVLSEVAVPATDQIAEIRRRSISWVISFYPSCETVSEKLSLLGILNSATRATRSSDPASIQMVSKDTLNVLGFFESLVQNEKVQIVEKLESHVYWIYFHSASEDVQSAALRFKAAADQNAEFQIFKILIGFEGVFGEWSRERNSDGEWDRKNEVRKESAVRLVESISPHNVAEWRARVLRYSEIESDDLATFPVYVFFLEKLASLRPEFALELVTSHADQIERFLVPLLQGLVAAGRRKEFTSLIELWISQGVHLLQCAYALDDASTFDRELLLRVLDISIQEKSVRAIVAAMTAAVSNYTDGLATDLESVFATALSALSRLESSAWIYELWFRPQTRKFLVALSDAHIDLLMENLMLLKSIDYHAEEILYIVAGVHPAKVLAFLVRRLEVDKERVSSEFEAIPFELHKLNEPLAKYPSACVTAVRGSYRGDYSSLIYGGARLLKTIFPSFSADFENELLGLVRIGDTENVEFVLAVLRNYDGQAFLGRICMAIVESLPIDDPLLTEIAIVLESTGVVMGEFGFVEAMEEKQKEASTWLDAPSEKVKKFANDYSTSLGRRIVEERARATEQIALRKAQYGEYE